MKFSIFIILLFAFVPLVIADPHESDDGGDGGFIDFPDLQDVVVSPILDGIRDFFNGFVKELFSSPINQLLSWFKILLGHSTNFVSLKPLWNLIRYVISIFYGVMVLFAGVKFLVSSSDPVGRDNAKTTLKNVVLMIVLVQASFIIYSLLGQISTGLTNGILGMIPENFFELNADYGVGLTFAFSGMIMFLTIFAIMNAGIQLLGIYAGLLLFPLGIFLYYFGFTKSFGRLLLLLSVGIMFLSFFQSIILLIASSIGSVLGMSGHPLIILIGIAGYNAFTTIIVGFLLVKAAFGVWNSNAGKVAKMVVVS